MLAQLLLGGAVELHVAPGRNRVVGRSAEPAELRPELALVLNADV